MSLTSPINVAAALRSCKIDANVRHAAMAERLYSTPICPVPTGLDQYGRPAGCLLSTAHQVPGCVAPHQQIEIENAMRPNYVNNIPALFSNPTLTGVGNASCDVGMPNICTIINTRQANLNSAAAAIGTHNIGALPFDVSTMLSHSTSVNCGYEISMAQANPAYAAALAASNSPCAQYVGTIANYKHNKHGLGGAATSKRR